MAETFAVKIAKEQAKLKRQGATATAAQRLQHASIEDTFLPVKDLEGQVVAAWGKQPDGSFGGSVKKSPEQPTLSAPILPTPVDGERVPNNFPVEWDGNVVTLTVPEVHGYTGVYYQMVANEAAADPSQAKLAGTIRDRLGGATTIVVPGTGLVAVWFQMVGADRVTKGPFSAASFVTVTARVDAQDIADRLNEFADGELPDGAYNNLMARLAEFLYVRADQIDVNSLAADTARMSVLFAGLAQFSEAQIDSLLGNSAKFKVIEGASITGGSLRTSSASGNGVTVDEGTISYYDIFSGNTRSHVAPYVEFGTGQVEGERPKIAAGPGGTGLVLSAGNDLNGQGSSLNPIVMHGQVLTDRVTLGDGAQFTKHGLMLANSSNVQLSGIQTEGPRTKLVGRVSNNHGPQDMYAHVRFNHGVFPNGSTTARGTLTWGAPVPSGTRYALVTLDAGLWDQARAFTINLVDNSSSGFRYRIQQTNLSGNSNLDINAIGFWQ